MTRKVKIKNNTIYQVNPIQIRDSLINILKKNDQVHVIQKLYGATNYYFSYLFTVIVFNILEIISTIYCAVQTRKGKHVEVFFFGNVTNLICRS